MIEILLLLIVVMMYEKKVKDDIKESPESADAYRKHWDKLFRPSWLRGKKIKNSNSWPYTLLPKKPNNE